MNTFLLSKRYVAITKGEISESGSKMSVLGQEDKKTKLPNKVKVVNKKLEKRAMMHFCEIVGMKPANHQQST